MEEESSGSFDKIQDAEQITTWPPCEPISDPHQLEDTAVITESISEWPPPVKNDNTQTTLSSHGVCNEEGKNGESLTQSPGTHSGNVMFDSSSNHKRHLSAEVSNQVREFKGIFSYQNAVPAGKNTDEHVFEGRVPHTEPKRFKLTHENSNPSGELLNLTDDKLHSGKTEVLASVALAKWWRREGRVLCADNTEVNNSSNPNTLLSIISRKAAAKKFMRAELRRLEFLSCNHGNRCGNASTEAALGSFHEKLGNLDSALAHLTKAISRLSDQNSWPHTYQWMLEKVKRQKEVADKQKKLMLRLNRRLARQTTAVCPYADRRLPSPKSIERRAADSLSWEEFFHNYATRSLPVIITGLVDKMTSVPWTLKHIQEKAGDCQVTLKRLVPHSVEWARLENAQTVTVSEFMDSLNISPAEQRYLFDWSLPIHCPHLAEEITIPKYFAGDFLQRTSKGSLYQNSWPSLFIAPSGLRSELHVDAFGSNFWMALFVGKKRWVLYDKGDTYSLYPQYEHSLDPVFGVDLGEPNLDTHPLLELTQPLECILEAGEVLFVPAGCPHRVENLETSLAISANYVDLSNLSRATEELRINGLTDLSAKLLYDQLSDESFPQNMNSDMRDMPWSEFKMWPQPDYENYHFRPEDTQSR